MALGAQMENKWRECDLSDCDYATIPGTPLRLPFQRGIPFIILQAFLRDLDAFIEPANNSRGYSDEGSWTDNNSVYTSNHKGASAFDYNWDDHALYVKDGGWNGSVLIQGNQVPAVRELIAFYTFEGLQMVWWGNDWNSPVDSMHFQMGYGTYEDQAKCQRFIARFIRADGFSTFRRANGPVTPPPLSRADGYAVKIIAEGRRRGITVRGIEIALATALVESNITVYANAKVPASMSIPHDAVGSDGYSVGIFQQQVRDTGNGWWWGDAATCMDPTSSAGLFYDRLAKLAYNGPNSPGSYAQDVQDSAFPDRYDQRFAEAVALYNRLATTPSGDDELSAEAERMIREVHGAMFNRVTSQSLYATPGEGPRWQLHEMVKNQDGLGHESFVEREAMRGNPAELARVVLVAQGRGVVTEPWAVQRAQRVLAEIEAAKPDVLRNYLASKGQA